MAGEDGIVSGMAGRYATALFELARESNAIDRVQSDLKFFDAAMATMRTKYRVQRVYVSGFSNGAVPKPSLLPSGAR